MVPVPHPPTKGDNGPTRDVHNYPTLPPQPIPLGAGGEVTVLFKQRQSLFLVGERQIKDGGRMQSPWLRGTIVAFNPWLGGESMSGPSQLGISSEE